MATTYLTRTLGTPTNNKKFTFSAWMKRGVIGVADEAFFSTGNSSDPITTFRWNSDGKIYLFYLSSSSMVWEFATNSLYRDCNGWYNVVIAFDSTESSGGDRLKLWVNGEQITTWSTQVNPSLNSSPTMNSAVRHDLGTNGPGGNYFTGLMSHVHFVDGTAYPASTFGSTDATSGEWVLNTSPSVTYGDNGFFILKDGNSVTDQSGEGNNWTVGAGTLTDLQDCPDDVFATWNPLAQKFSNIVYEHCNTTNATSSDIGQRQSISTLANSSGKFYMECKLAAIGSNVGGSYPYVGISAYNKYVGDTYVGNAGCGWTTGGDVYNGGSNYSSGTSYTTGDIIGVAVDITNSKLYFHKDGTYISNGSGVGNPSSGTNGIDISARTAEDAIAFVTSLYNNNGTWQCNFGNGYFGTTAISSEGTNASEIGKFEYDVPTGYTALSLKGLQE